jgi:hypothetical protein
MKQEAIASIREVCPDELANYQATINNLFGDAPVASLNSSSDFEPQATEPTSPVEPTPPADSQTVDVVVKAEVVTEPKPEETGLSVIKINGVKERQEAVEKILKVYFPHVKSQEDVKNYRVPTTEKQVREFLRDKIGLVDKPATFVGDNQAWSTNQMMQAVRMETTGKQFWGSVLGVLKWIELNTQS